MELQEQYQIIEDALIHLGLKPEDARCEQEGQWLVYRGNLEIYVDVWKEEANEWSYHPNAHNMVTFQVVCPICRLPENDKKVFFYEDLLQMNFYSHWISFVVNKKENMLSCAFKRGMENISKGDIIEAIDATGYYADLAWKMLNQPYELEKV
jgi:hypothetical protein